VTEAKATSSLENQRWVIKIGSALITDNGTSLARDSLGIWVDQIVQLKKMGAHIVLISSGSVAEGMHRMEYRNRPGNIHELQATAAIGQAGLIQAYESFFTRSGNKIAQILLVHDDLSSRKRYLNARQTINTLLDWGIVPIVNENDTVATDEIRFGDNDTLAGLVSNLIDADRLVILTDQPGVLTSDPRNDPNATLISECDVHDAQLDAAAGGSSSGLGRGGMTTKISAARLAARSGTVTHIANGRDDSVLLRIARGEQLGTRLTNQRKPVTSRKQWLAGNLTVKGRVVLDEGAKNALLKTGVSLLPIGVTKIEGVFERGDLVSCVDSQNREIARGLSNYSSEEASKIVGRSSSAIPDILGYGGDNELIHYDDLVIL